MISDEEIATTLLQSFDLSDEKRGILVQRLALVISMSQSWKDGKAFMAPLSGKEARKQLDKLQKALNSVRSSVDEMDDRVFRAVNREWLPGDIPLLDYLAEHSGGGRTDAPQRILEIFYELSERLSEQTGAIQPTKGKSGKDDTFTRFLATQLSYIFRHASGEQPARRTDWATGESYGPFLEFVSNVVLTLSLDLSPETIVKKTGDSSLYNTPISPHSPLSADH